MPAQVAFLRVPQWRAGGAFGAAIPDPMPKTLEAVLANGDRIVYEPIVEPVQIPDGQPLPTGDGWVHWPSVRYWRPGT